MSRKLHLALALLVLSSGGGRARAQFTAGLYVVEYGEAGYASTPGVYQVTGLNTKTSILSSTNDLLYNPLGIAVSADGSHMYVADATYNEVNVYTKPSSGPASSISLSSLKVSNGVPSQPTGLALDSSGNVYVALDNNSSNSVTYSAVAEIKSPNSSPTVTTYGPSTGISSPSGLAFDGSGNLYVGQSGVMGNGITNPTTSPPHVYQIPSGGSSDTTLSISPALSGQATPGLTVYGNNLYVAVQTSSGGGAIERVSTSGGTAATISSDSAGPRSA